jgi:hypothetical protein
MKNGAGVFTGFRFLFGESTDRDGFSKKGVVALCAICLKLT